MVFKKRFYLCAKFLSFIKTVKNMAMEIKSCPVLEGQAAVEFYERWAKCTERKTKEEVQESMRKSRAFFAKYCNPYTS